MWLSTNEGGDFREFIAILTVGAALITMVWEGEIRL